MSKALADEPPRSFNPAPYLPSTSLRVVFRDGRWRRDNGYCPNTRVVSYFSDSPPSTTARCYANEVSVPILVGRSVESARSALATVPLSPDVIYVPAEPRTRPGEVVRQLPRGGGFLSANGTVRIFVTAAPDGLVPNLVGSSLPDAPRAEPEAPPQAPRPLRRGPVGHGAPAERRGRDRGAAGAADHAARRARLDQLVPAST